MLEKALKGSQKYWSLLAALAVLAGIGFACFLLQLNQGLKITGMSRDVSWGFYIAQFTFLVGVAASAVMVVLPYYLHHVKDFGRITIMGEFLAVSAVTMCLLFIVVDLGQPMRLLNVLLHPTPNSILFWDMIVLNGYLFLNIVIGWTVLGAERKEMPPPKWVKPLIYLSIPWAVSIHTVTAFLYAGLPGRHFWLSAIMAARFLASAFASGPALLILLCYLLRKRTNFDPGDSAINKLSQIVTYAAITSVFFLILEVFTAFYSRIPGHMHGFIYQFTGYEGHGELVPFMWLSVILSATALVLLVPPKFRHNEKLLKLACVAVFFGLWLEKGVGLVVTGFIPNVFDKVTPYVPTLPELGITIGVWATGFLVLTILYKVAVGVKEEIGA
ncbi:putative sulfite reductase-associated electron transfer protein DsrP [Desulfacinum hydrothermale DSM 13146]|uniref:Putative sulfite reductase-associated electron transfer protein DsrP n=1 Tax=Desulfacinum hydrothermale DSM 13146 TaxID=1121390 RepID=A0A1W1XLE4_9BACT|nr:NrfD/PsrC family molybdoenzyme membrane anchor subunit [Desulfacinum hydrothermale]SMC24790.1 putative sulfite reductase-associated electron transfer protein DsrP [Desulfacinum hydrothermale DSM 13146]